MKSFFTIALITLCSQSFGQLTKNNWLVGGAGSLYSYTEDFTSPSSNYKAKYTDINLNASVGYFFIDKFAAGLRPVFYSYKGESNSGGQADNIQFAIGPYARYYFLNQEKQFNLLIDASYQLGLNRDMSGIETFKGKFNFFSVMAGSEVFFTTSVGIQILLGYSQRLVTNISPLGTLKNIKNGFQTSIGFNFHLEKE